MEINLYKNNSIPRRLSNTRENFGGNNLKQGQCDLSVTESRISYKLKEISSSQRTEFLMMAIDSVEMALSQEKVESISKRRQNIFSMQEVSIKDLAKLLGTLSSTALAALPAPLYISCLQRQQIHNLYLVSLCKVELNW